MGLKQRCSRSTRTARIGLIVAAVAVAAAVVRLSHQIQLSARLIAAVKVNDAAQSARLLWDGADPNVRVVNTVDLPLRDWIAMWTGRKSSPTVLALALAESRRRKYPDTAIALQLVEHGARIDFKGEMGEGIVAQVVRHENFDRRLLKILLTEKHCRPIYDCPTDICSGQSLWSQATYTHNLILMKALVESGLGTNGPDHPLIEAVREGDASAVEFLLRVGADPNFAQHGQGSVLAEACGSEYEPEAYGDGPAVRKSIVDLLLRHGANPCVSDNNGRNAYDVARSRDRLYLFPALIDQAILTPAGIRPGQDTDAMAVHRYGPGLRTRSKASINSVAWSERYYTDSNCRFTIRVVSETDTINLVEIRSGVHVPNPTMARLSRTICANFTSGMSQIAGLKMGCTREEVVKRLGVPTTNASWHPVGRSLYYEQLGCVEKSPRQAYEALFKFKNGRLVDIIVYSGEFM